MGTNPAPTPDATKYEPQIAPPDSYLASEPDPELDGTQEDEEEEEERALLSGVPLVGNVPVLRAGVVRNSGGSKPKTTWLRIWRSQVRLQKIGQ